MGPHRAVNTTKYLTAMFSLSFSYATSTQHKFCLEKYFFLSAVSDFLGQASPTQIVQSDTLLGILTTNVMSYQILI